MPAKTMYLAARLLYTVILSLVATGCLNQANVAKTTAKGDEIMGLIKDSWTSDTLSFLTEERLTEENWSAWVADKNVPSNDIEHFHLLKAILTSNMNSRITPFLPASILPDINTIYSGLILLPQGIDRMALPLILDGRKTYCVAMTETQAPLEFHIELNESEKTLYESPEKAYSLVKSFCDHILLRPEAPGEYIILAAPTSQPKVLAFEGSRTWPTALEYYEQPPKPGQAISNLRCVMTPQMLRILITLPVRYEPKSGRVQYTGNMYGKQQSTKEDLENSFLLYLNRFTNFDSSVGLLAKETLAEIRGEIPAK